MRSTNGNEVSTDGATVAIDTSSSANSSTSRRVVASETPPGAIPVGDRHPALHRQRPHALQHQVGGEHAELPRLVQVDVDGHLVLLGQAEHDVEVPDGVAVQLARVDAAHDVGPALSADSSSGTVPVAEQAGLGEGDHLDRAPVGVLVRAASTASNRSRPQSTSTCA